MSTRTQALLEYYFDHECHAFYSSTTEQDQADVIVIDYDHPGSKDGVADGKWRTERPLLLLSFGETEVAGAVVIGKPFDKSQLQEAALKLIAGTGSPPLSQIQPEPLPTEKSSTPPTRLESPVSEAHNSASPELQTNKERSAVPGPDPLTMEANTSEAQSADANSDSSNSASAKAELDDKTPPPADKNSAKKNTNKAGASNSADARRARQQAKIALLCGPARTLADFESSGSAHYFSEELYLSYYLKKALRMCGSDGVIAVQVSLPNMEIYLLHWLQKILTTKSLKSSKNVETAFKALSAEDVILTPYRSDTVNELVKRVNGTGKFSFSTDAFIWLSALFSARGRLPNSIGLDEKWRLNHWPNLTRLEPVPNSVEIASAWARDAASIRQIITETGYDARQITSFFNGACALKLMEKVLSDTETHSSALPAAGVPIKEYPKEG